MIENNVVKPNIESFNYLRENFEGKQIELFEKHREKFLENIAELGLTTNEVESLIKSEKLNTETKILCIQQLSDTEIMNSLIISKFLVVSLASNTIIDFSNEIKKSILLNEDLNISNRIRFFESNYDCISSEEIDVFLHSLGDSYVEISDIHKRATIALTEDNKLLLKTLEHLGYISSFNETKKGYTVYHSREK